MSQVKPQQPRVKYTEQEIALRTREAAKRMTSARTSLVLDQPFFGVLALRLHLQADWGCKGAWVDGRTLGYDPLFVNSLTHKQLVGLVAHEVMHCAAGHPWRRDARELKTWNDACDQAINGVLREAGFELPADANYAQEEGRSAEFLYDRLYQERPKDGGGQSGGDGDGDDDEDGDGGGNADGDGDGDGDGQGEGNGSGYGKVRDAPSDAAADGATEPEWGAATQQAAQAAKSAGKLPNSLKRFVKEATKPKVDWRNALRRFVQEVTNADYTLQRPNPRYAASGIYAPSLRSESMGSIFVAIDTSGSIDEATLTKFTSEVRALVSEVKPSTTHVAYCDARLHRVDEFGPEDDLTFDPVGGGGTDFRPVFAHVERMDDTPKCVIYLTDMEGTFPESCDVPTLWVVFPYPDHLSPVAPFGESVEIQ